MNKYKLINKQTEERICEKVVIDGWDYYVSDKMPNVGSPFYDKELNCVAWRTDNSLVHKNDVEIIATNNPIIDIPKVVDETWIFFKEVFGFFTEEPIGTCEKDQYEHWLYKSGYNKSQETHPFTEEDVKEIFKIAQMQKNYGDYKHYTFEEAIQLWKKERPKTLYYE